jgi:RNA polymerase sigma-70 factor (ECF subfamily)
VLEPHVKEPVDFARVYARYLPPIQAKCRRLLGRSAAAEDVVQETFLRLWKSGVAEGGDVRTVMAWLYRTCTRLAIDVLRERRWTDPGEGVAEATPCAVDLGAATAAKAAILSLAATVPGEELAVAVLCRVDGLSQPEAATVLGVSDRTVRRFLDRFDERTGSLRKELLS